MMEYVGWAVAIILVVAMLPVFVYVVQVHTTVRAAREEVAQTREELQQAMATLKRQQNDLFVWMGRLDQDTTKYRAIVAKEAAPPPSAKGKDATGYELVERRSRISH